MQDRQSREAGDARLRLLAAGWIAKAIVVGCALTLICTLSVLQSAFRVTSEAGVQAISNDFRVFWSAGTLALQGDYLAVFDTAALTAVHNVNPDDWMPWLYPPGFLLLLAPFGALSFATGFALLAFASILAIALATRSFARGSAIAWAAFSLAPAYLPILLLGQNGLLWLAGLIIALAALRDGRWVLAGLVIGLLTLKPQFGLLIPVALIAAGLWRTTLVATLTTLVVAALPTLLTGPEYWSLFLQRMAEYGERVIGAIHELWLMSSPLALFVRLGVAPELALSLQAAVTLAAGIAVFLIWRARGVSFDVKAAALLAGSLLASPYAWHYEAALMAPVGLFLLRAGVLGPGLWHRLILAVLWLGAGLQAMAIFVGLGEGHFPWALLVTPVMLFCLGLCVAHLRSGGATSVEGA